MQIQMMLQGWKATNMESYAFLSSPKNPAHAYSRTENMTQILNSHFIQGQAQHGENETTKILLFYLSNRIINNANCY